MSKHIKELLDSTVEPLLRKKAAGAGAAALALTTGIFLTSTAEGIFSPSEHPQAPCEASANPISWIACPTMDAGDVLGSELGRILREA